jgi:hypothetical protein
MTSYRVIEPSGTDKGYGILINKIRIVEYISNDYNAVQRLAEECNAGAVEMEFFDEILEDYLPDCTRF